MRVVEMLHRKLADEVSVYFLLSFLVVATHPLEDRRGPRMNLGVAVVVVLVVTDCRHQDC